MTDTPLSDDVVERVTKAMHDAVAGDGTIEDLALVALEAARYGEMVETLQWIAENDWFRTPQPPHNIDGTNRKVSGEFANKARALLSSIGAA